MTTDVALPLVVVLGIVTVLLVRFRAVRSWEAVVIGLFGFYLGFTPIGWAVMAAFEWLLGGFLTH
ncbi:hypothetical protein ACFVUW_07305 [Streptomyces xiamenensis]|uniref:hypothetical protein n=1 Tax=Streptomyces TaxID=1883 RepID=UPI003395983C